MTEQTSVTVIKGGVVWTGGDQPEVRHGDVVIEDGLVAAIEPAYRGHATVELDAQNCLVLPGLFNAHTHPGGTPLIRGIAEDCELPPNGAFFHNTASLLALARTEMTADEYAAILEWDVVAMLQGGATTIIDEHISNIALWPALVEQYGFRCNLGLTYPQVIGSPNSQAAYEGFEANLRLHDEYNGAFGDRLRVHLSPHGPDTVTDEVLRDTRIEATRRGMTIHLHLAQHMGEVLTVKARSGGMTPVHYLQDMGFLGPDVLATHATYLEGDDVDVLAETRTNIVYCGYRKAKEALTSPYVEFLDRDVNVTLGTDTFAHDLIEGMKFGAMLGKVRGGRISRPTADDLVRGATVAPATALARKDLGRLEPGAKGDAVVVNVGTPFNFPAFDALKNLVYYSSASDIRHTVVDGVPVVRDRVVVGADMDALRNRVSTACERIWTIAPSRDALPNGAVARH